MNSLNAQIIVTLHPELFKIMNNRQKREPKKQIQEPALVRLNKFIANSGVCSRRDADDLIKAGYITVNGIVVTDMGIKINPGDEVKHKGKKLSSEKRVYILLNKPKGFVTTTKDPHAERTVMDLIKNIGPERLFPVGRLDKNTTGLLLITNDGDLASRLSHPKYNKKKIYHVWLDKPVTKNDLITLIEGVAIGEKEVVTADAASFVDEEDKSQIGIEIHSGQNRVVRRMFETMGYKVKKLDRVYYAGLTKKNLPRGKWRFLTDKEISTLKKGSYT